MDWETESRLIAVRVLSIFSRVSRVKVSTSAAVRSLVGIGSRTVFDVSLVYPRNSSRWLQTFYSNGSTIEPPSLDIKYVTVVLRHNGYDGYPSLYGEMERPLLEG